KGSILIHRRGLFSLGDTAAHEVSIDVQGFPIGSDQQDRLVIKDQASGDVRVFTADKELRRFTISHGGQTLIVRMNPDATWMVGGERAPTPKEAARLLLTSPVLSSVSPHIIAGLYAHVRQSTQPANTTDSSTAVGTCLTDKGIAYPCGPSTQYTAML